MLVMLPHCYGFTISFIKAYERAGAFIWFSSLDDNAKSGGGHYSGSAMSQILREAAHVHESPLA